jgi:hypothetical protein
MRRIFGRHQREPSRTLEPVRIYTAAGTFDGSITPAGERVTDLLQQGQGLEVLPLGADAENADAWIHFESSEIQMVVPPPHVSPRQLRLVRNQREVRLRVGGHRAVGTAHLRPGVERDPYTLVTRPFLPLTNASVMRDDGQEWDSFDVVIVNLERAEFIDY